LRTEAAAEARWVAAQCQRMNIPHTILRWEGDKPSTGIPAAARQARYALLSEWARSHGADCILLGHTLDDQAETVAYRIASNGGVRGAAGLRALSVCPIWPEGRGVLLSRPLLQTRRSDLQALLRDRGQAWIDDPSNEDLRYGRPRMRAKLQALSETRPDLIPRLAAIGDRLAAEQAAIEAEALALLEAHLQFDPFGAGLLDPAPLRAASRDVRAAALGFAILAVSGEAHAPALAALPDLWARLEAKACAVTLGGARIGRLGAKHGHNLLLTRDPGAAAGRTQPRPDLVLQPGETGVFDGRFELSTGRDLSGPVHIRALGAAAAKGVNLPERLRAALKDAAAHARAALPGIYFANDSNSATAPIFSADGAVNMAEASDKPRILARFLGKVRLEAQRAAVKAPLIGPI
jgi:tRNA(Ile)-lysidine synthase